MNCEQRYNNALKRARIGLHDCNLLDCDNMTRRAAITTIYHLFPELAEDEDEDEDERIRKGIIRNLQYLMDRSEGFVKEDLQERIAWLEKQGEFKSSKWTEGDVVRHGGVLALVTNGRKAMKSNCEQITIQYPDEWVKAETKERKYFFEQLEKQGEQPTDKVEPKFKVGDWVILNGVVAKILDKQKYGFIGLDIDGKDFFCNYGHTDSMRLWTINDAKDGDILVNSKGNPFIFTGKFTTNYHNPTAYCGIGNENKFIVCALNWRFHWAEKKEVAPATEEQRELLFEKMKQAGYQWDSEKKELKKIESKKLDADKVIEWMRVKAPKWLYDTVYPIRLDVDAEDLIKQFKKDFGL